MEDKRHEEGCQERSLIKATNFIFFPRLNVFHSRGNRGRGNAGNIYASQGHCALVVRKSADINRMLVSQKGHKFVISLGNLTTRFVLAFCSWVGIFHRPDLLMNPVLLNSNYNININNGEF